MISTRQDGETIWLNIAAWAEQSVANGPGERFVLWVQGCPLHCPSCFNEEYMPFVQRQRMSVDEAAAMILGTPGIEGVTYSGGEPMAQPKGLYHLGRLIKGRGLTLVCYSGYTLDELEAMRNPWVPRLLSCIDILIDGRYEQAQRASLPWRGSRNQRVHFLTNTYRHLEAQVNQAHQELEFIVGKDGFVSTGIFSADFVKRLEEVLQGDL